MAHNLIELLNTLGRYDRSIKVNPVEVEYRWNGENPATLNICASDQSGSGQNSAEETQPGGETNKSSPKLPEYSEVCAGIMAPKWASKETYLNGVTAAYNFIVGKIGR